jgi:glycosyltransferase involved in cell wall biosynthesis
LTSSIALHKGARTWHRSVDAYITPTEFDRSIFVRAGFDPNTIHVKPNFVHDAPAPEHGERSSLLFVGRLAPEKGIDTLIDAWRQLRKPIPLEIVGDGPLRSLVERCVTESGGMVRWLGSLDRGSVFRRMAASRAVVVPSTYYETFCLVAAEAGAAARPAIVTGHGSLAEVVDDGQTGWHVPLRDPAALADAMQAAWNDRAESERRGQLAREKFERCYTPERNIEMLATIYERAIDASKLQGRNTSGA